MAQVVRHEGSVASLHGRDPFAERDVTEPEIWWCDFEDAALVLGSRQTPDLLDLEACDRAGLSVVRRRSGGGAVLLRPDSVVWIDVVLPHGIAPDDVRGSMVWIGERWKTAIEPWATDTLSVHGGGMVCTPWSDLVCFTGFGPGEVIASDRKLVGLSQRRGRHGLRIQGLVHRRALLSEMPELFRGPLPDAALVEPAAVDGVAAEALAARLAARL